MSESLHAPINARLRALRVVPVIVIDDPDRAISLAESLAEGGLPCAEVTFRTEGAEKALTRIARARPDFLVGAGTVTTTEQADLALDAGAQFAVAPGMNPRVVEHCLKIGLPIYPGVCTPSDIERAMEFGLRTLKFFPAEPSGGVKYLKAIAAPYGALEFMPTGGITRESLGSYLGYSRVVACGGSWMAPAEWITEGAFERIRDETFNVMSLVSLMDPHP
ncbi:MAG: bifunctional 4-hydroxy-2-oxoglutarate aldolase/2-dehydro-3-deoxy-phosphogluconate aldolase [Gemmatimonadota bacterium]